MFCLAAGASGAVLLFQAQQHANTGHNQQHTNAAEQQGAETTGGGQVEALAVDDGSQNIAISRGTWLSTKVLFILGLFLMNQLAINIVIFYSPTLFVRYLNRNFNRAAQQIIAIYGCSFNQIISTIGQAIYLCLTIRTSYQIVFGIIIFLIINYNFDEPVIFIFTSNTDGRTLDRIRRTFCNFFINVEFNTRERITVILFTALINMNAESVNNGTVFNFAGIRVNFAVCINLVRILQIDRSFSIVLT